MNAGIVFPGMGPAGYADLGKFIATDSCARRLRRIADEALGYPLMDLYRAAESDYSEYSQVAFMISCVALAERAPEKLGAEPVACAGPSFGAKAALSYAGSLPLPEAILLVARLARCEEEYFRGAHQDVVTQSVARTPEPELRKVLDAMAERGEWHDISCQIDADFFMVSLRERSLDRFLADVRTIGGLPLYAMRPPMHSAVFAALRRKVEEEVLADFRFRDPTIPIIADYDGLAVSTADGVRAMLLEGIVRQVRWPAAVRSMRSIGITRIAISGPDSLFGRVRCTTDNFTVAPLNPRMALLPKNLGRR